MDKLILKADFHPEGLSQGRLARLDGISIISNPYQAGTLMFESWNKGWSEVDSDPCAPKEALCH